MKRVAELIMSVIFLIFCSPLFLIVTLLIYKQLGKPILFKQQRPGLYGKPFTIYKFRTMQNAYDENGFLLSDEARIHPLGEKLRKYSLDELPQLFNILKGDMSFVGPRPLLMEYLPLYSLAQMKRHDVKPGITGLSQVSGRNNLPWEKRFELDVYYVQHQSLKLDCQIVYRTVQKVLRSEGVTQEGSVTMTKFKK